MTENITIGTHNGVFHCDEVLAVFLLKQLPEYKDATVVRTRDQSVLDTCSIVVDVGGVYDAEKKRFDHHQRGFHHSMSSVKPGKPWVTKLSSAGLVYAHFGERILSQILGEPEDQDSLQKVYDKVYDNFVEEIDAIDNGISTHDGLARYKVTTTLSARVGHLNPPWNEEKPDETSLFEKAMQLVGAEFVERVNYYNKTWLSALDIVRQAIEKRKEVHSSGCIVLLEPPCPWKEHLFLLEKELDVGRDLLYVIFEDQSHKWRVQCVPYTDTSFECRRFLPEEWRGMRDEELSELAGIPSCVFVHAAGFIGGNVSKEGAIAMAVKALPESEHGDS